jgi:dTMP kinase
MPKGKFITFEGADGCGKTTIANMIHNELQDKGINSILTREPGGTAEGEKIRELLLSSDVNLHAISEFLLITAARYEHYRQKIKPMLDDGIWVICDRFFDSSLVYQGYHANIPLAYLQMLHNMIFANFQPDHTFILDIDINTAKERMRGRAEKLNRFDLLGDEFQMIIRKSFQEIARNNPHRCHLVDASKSLEEIAWGIMENIGGHFLSS